MARGTSQITVEALLVLLGKESPDRFVASLILFILGDSLLTHEVLSMLETIYIPDGLLLPVVLILAVMAVVGPVLWAVYKKNESKSKLSDWSSRYIITMVLDMVATPSLGLIVMSLIVQKWIPDISDVTYLVFLPIVLLIVSYFVLTLLNEGWKALAEQLAKNKDGVKEVIDAIKDKKN